MNRQIFLAALGSAVATSTSTLAQTNTMVGAASEFAAGISFTGSTNSDDVIRLKAPGNQQIVPPGFDPANFPAGTPDYRIEVMFPYLTAAQLRDLDINAMSTDNPIPDILPSGVPVLQNMWMSVNVSFDEFTAGNDGSLLNTRFQNPNITSGSDIYGHYVDGSAMIASNLVGETLLEIGAPKIRAAGNEIDALDFGLGLMLHRQVTSAPVILSGNVFDFYFSISYQSAGALSAPNTFPGIPQVEADSVYRVTWRQVGNAWGWSNPVEVFSLQDFGVESEEDIDALSYSSRFGGIFIFSTDREGSGTRPQFEVYKNAWGASGPVELMADASTTMLQAFEVDEDPYVDPDGICILDPEVGFGVYDHWVGTTTDSPFIQSTVPWMNVSACMQGSQSTPGPIFYRALVSGVPTGFPIWVSISLDYDPANTTYMGSWSTPDLNNPVGYADADGMLEFVLPIPAGMPETLGSLVFLTIDPVTANLTTSNVSTMYIHK